MLSAGLSGWAYAAVLFPLAVPLVFLYGVMTSAKGKGTHSVAVHPRSILAFALGVSPALIWHSLFGYLQLWLNPLPSLVPRCPVTTSYAFQYLSNAPNMLYSFVGLFSYPLYGIPLVLLGLAVAIRAFLRDGEEHLAQVFAFSIIVVISVYVFAAGDIGVDNWRYFYLLVPFGALLDGGRARPRGRDEEARPALRRLHSRLHLQPPAGSAGLQRQLSMVLERGPRDERLARPRLAPLGRRSGIDGPGLLAMASPERHAARLREHL